MSEGEPRRGIVASVAKVAEGLPSSLLVLLVINTAFLGGLFWMLERQTQSRETVIMRLLDNCIEHQQKDGTDGH